MYCIIQEINQKRQNDSGHSKKLVISSYSYTYQGKTIKKYSYNYSTEKFERPINKSYKITIRESYREKGKVKAKQYCICTVDYYSIVDGWFYIYDYKDNISKVSEKFKVEPDKIWDIINLKLDPLEERLHKEYEQTDEYRVEREHEEIISLYNKKKTEFSIKYEIDKDEYDCCYDVFGNLMNKEYLNKIKYEHQKRKEYEKRSRSYYENYNSNYSRHSSNSYGNYSGAVNGNENKDILKQFYRTLSKKYHPDANNDLDTENHMKLLNALKSEWGV